MSRKVLGIDIRDNTLTAVLVQTGLRGNRLEAWERVSLPEVLSDSESRKDMDQAFSTVFSGMNLAGASCVVSLPGASVSYRNMRLPFKGAKKIRQIMPFELEPELPFSVDELVFDFHEIKNQDGYEGTEFIAVAAEREQIAEILSLLSSHRIEPEIITAGGFPMALCLGKFFDLPETCAFLDIDIQYCTLFLILSKEVRLVRSFTVDDTPENRNTDLFTQVRRTLLSIEGQGALSDVQPEVIFGAGPGVTLCMESGNPSEASEKMLGIPFRVVNMLEDAAEKVSRSFEADPSATEAGHAFAGALMETEGVACPNFRTGPFAPMRRWEEHKNALVKIVIALIFIVLLYSINILVENYSREKKIANLEQQMAAVFKSTFPNEELGNDPLARMRAAIEEKQETTLFPDANRQSILVIDILDEMSRKTGGHLDVELMRLVIDTDHFMITGNTDTFNSVDEIQGKIESSSLFQKVEIMNTGRSGPKIQFKLKVTFK